jgi:RNA polymerase sigma factor (sigma-70 family)
MNDSQKLLADYVKNASEAAFRELVRRYINLVHSTAIRLVNGDSHLAEDIAQTVFMDLARKARTLPPDVMLGGWLHRDACFVAGTTMRGERRRQFRERQAVAMNIPEDHTAANLALVAPVLDEAINQLEPDDRTAILLRFFEQLEFRAVGEAMGSGEDAARMRVNRALDKLHALMTHRGAAFSAAALGAALAAGAVTAAPNGLAATVAATALASVATGGATATILKLMTITKLKIGIVSAIAIAALAVPVVIQQQSLSNLREENQALQQQGDQLAALQAENQRLSNLVAEINSRPADAEKQVRELARLRNEVGILRDQTNIMGDALAKSRQFNTGGARFGSDKRGFHPTTMPQFAKFIAGVLQAPVADQTGLKGYYDIEMTPLRLGGVDGRVQRVTGILLTELGLRLDPFDGPFTAEEQQFKLDRTQSFTHQVGTDTTVVTSTADGSSATNGGGFAIKLDHSDAPGLKVYTGEADFAAQRSPDSVFANVLTKQDPNQPLGDVSPASKMNACINNLRLIDASKQQWALEFRKQNTDTPTADDLRPYLGRGPNGELPVCPDHGIYTYGTVREKPTCSVPGHVLP